MIEIKKARRKVALILGNHRLTSLAALPFFEFCEKNEIIIDEIVASGGGVLAAGLKGAGHTPVEMQEILKYFSQVPLYKSLDYRTILSLIPFLNVSFHTPASIFKSTQWQKVLEEIFGNKKIENSMHKLFFQATDVLNAKGVLLTTGNLREAVYAASAAFPLHPPIYVQNHWLVSGSYSHPLPILQSVHNVTSDVLIAINVEQDFGIHRSYTHFLANFIDRVMARIEQPQHPIAVDLHHHSIVFIPVKIGKNIEFANLNNPTISRIVSAARIKIQERADDIFEALTTGFE